MDRPHWVVTNCQTGELFTRLMSQKAVSVRPVFLPEENLGEKISWSRRIIFRLLPRRFHDPNRKSNLETVSACCVAEGLSINNEKWKHWLSSWAAGVDSDYCQYYTYRRPARDYPRWLSAGLAAMSADDAWPAHCMQIGWYKSPLQGSLCFIWETFFFAVCYRSQEGMVSCCTL